MGNKSQKNIIKCGDKAIAHRIFHSLGLFKKTLLIFSPKIALEKIQQEITDSEINLNRLSVRFSYKNNINMPRGFFLSLPDALKFIEKNKRVHESASIIVHEIIFPNFSYELYWNNNTFYIQIIPGIWEIDNTNPPDIVLQVNNKTILYSYTRARFCKYLDINCDFMLKNIPPISLNDLEKRYYKIDKLKSRLKKLKSEFNPLFCHFLEDSTGNLFFINARKTIPFNLINTPHEDPKIFHKISNLKDIDLWDGHKPILFDITCSRANTSSFIKTVEILSHSIQEVYVNYGLLSHPAIILREFGIDVKQVYTIYTKKVLSKKN